MSENRLLQVSAIENGTVIDHIPANKLFEVITILGLQNINTMITFGTNLESRKLNKKAIIKIEDHYFEKEDINRIALVAPEARLNIIKDYKVSEKQIVETPKKITDIAKCANPQCITNNELMSTKFTVIKEPELSLHCHYCEKITLKEQIDIIKHKDTTAYGNVEI